VAFDKLLTSIALGNRDEDSLTSLAGRLAGLDREIDEKDKEDIKKVANGVSLRQLINGLLDAVDPDKHAEKAKEMFKTDKPTPEQIQTAGEELVNISCAPFDSPDLRNTIIDIKKRNEQIIDVVSKDRVTFAGYDAKAKERAKTIVDSFKKFIEDNKDEITALQIIFSKPYAKRHITYDEIKDLAAAIKKPPYHLTPDVLWQAYEQLGKSKVRGAGPQKLLTDLISLVRYAVGTISVLEPFPSIVNHRFDIWVGEQEKAGKEFTPEQKDWLLMIKDHIATSLSITMDDFDSIPFYAKGGRVKVYKLFGDEIEEILEDLNEVLAA